MRYRKYLIIGLIIAIVSALMLPSKEKKGSARDYAAIEKEGILRATIEYGANSYHVNDAGEMEGFHYQLIKLFAEEHGLTLEVIPEMSQSRQNTLLESGTCDLIANGRLLTTDIDTTRMQYTRPVTVDRLLLIQRKADTDTLCPHLQTPIDLAGKTICIPENSLFKQRIQHIMEEIGDSIYIREIPRYGSEQLMAMVAHGDICYAVCEENIVRTHLHQYPQLDAGLPIGFNQFYSWVVSAQSPTLLDSINVWIEQKGIKLR
jgi:membrane-bound lytic murein transglycosylase MltF